MHGGKTPIFEPNNAAAATALLRRGADPDARDNEGQTALFDHYFDEPNTVLAADSARLKAMIARATARKWTDVLLRLQAAASK